MEKTKFKKLLFDIACTAVACDGHIDEREVKELQRIEKSTTYFEGINLTRKLDRFVESFKNNPEETIEEIIYKLKDSLLNPVEEMLVLEIALRLVYSDTKIDPKEIDFLQSIRACLSIDDEIMTQRFGVIDFLVSSQEKIAVADENSKRKDSLDSVDMTNLENMYFSVGDKKE